MRTLRSAFVVTITAAACSRPAPTPPQMETAHNPPALPDPTPAPPTNTAPAQAATCPPRETLRDGAPCASPGLECYTPTGGCQPSGFRCAEGVWHEVAVTCNPPPPPRP